MPTGYPKNGKAKKRGHGVKFYEEHGMTIPMSVLRRDHTKIPVEDYKMDWKSAQRTKRGMVYKNNYAPLGREPSFMHTKEGWNSEYEKAKDTLTNKGWNGLSAKARAEYHLPRGVDAKYGNYVVVKALQDKKKKKSKKSAPKTESSSPMAAVDKAFNEAVKESSKAMKKATRQAKLNA